MNRHDKKEYQESIENALMGATSDESLKKKLESLKRYKAKSREEKFAGTKFYQSFDKLGIEGTRDTTLRLKVYKIDEFLGKEDQVLNIGSNCGFLDLEIAEMVGSITSLEHSVKLTTMQKMLANYYNIDNVIVTNQPFTLQTNLCGKYSAIFLLAVISHLKIEPSDLVEKVKSLLTPGGKVLLESHSIHSKSRYSEYLDEFIKGGFKILYSDKIEVNIKNRDRKRHRNFCWLQLEE